MKRIDKTILFSILLALNFPLLGFNQNILTQDSIKSKLLMAAKEIMDASHTCALITLDQGGNPRTRMVETIATDSSFTIWFGTNPRSRKVKQIKADNRVSIYYADALSSGYVTIQGLAVLVNDSLEKEKHWKEGWKAYYPDKKNDFVLIKIIPQKLEIISYTHGIIGDPKTWEPPSVIFKR